MSRSDRAPELAPQGAPYSEDPGRDLDATALSIVRVLPRGQHGTTYPDVSWEPKEAFHAMARYYRQEAAG